MLQRGDSVPHFDVATVEGSRVRYSTIWQRRNLVLVVLPALESDASHSCTSRLMARQAEFVAQDTECVVTRDALPGVPPPGVVVADRWGEIVHAAHPSRVEDLTPPEELLEWIEYLTRRCPECEGEAR